jgi:hypothetical protein
MKPLRKKMVVVTAVMAVVMAVNTAVSLLVRTMFSMDGQNPKLNHILAITIITIQRIQQVSLDKIYHPNRKAV